jgi:hypothetical protein
VTGLAYAGGTWDDSKYTTFIPDKDNILPITDVKNILKTTLSSCSALRC